MALNTGSTQAELGRDHPCAAGLPPQILLPAARLWDGSQSPIIAALKRVEAGRSTEDVARDQGLSKHTIYAWKSKYGGMGVSEAQEVKQLRDENARLKKRVADLAR
jgi:putative transposase